MKAGELAKILNEHPDYDILVERRKEFRYSEYTVDYVLENIEISVEDVGIFDNAIVIQPDF